MKAEEFVKSELPDVRLVVREGTFIGGRYRYEIMLGKKCIGMDTLPRCAWAEAMRWIKADAK